jgi:lipid A 3-O-deacylase
MRKSLETSRRTRKMPGLLEVKSEPTTLGKIVATQKAKDRTVSAAFSIALAGVVAFMLFLLPPGKANAQNDDPAFLVFGAGYFDFNKQDDTAVEFRLEYHSDYKFLGFKPFGGVTGTTDESYFFYAGIMMDLYWGRRWVTSLSVAPGYYEKGNGRDLGHHFEIRSQFELAYRFDNRSRLGVSVSHMSNASISDSNPGQETVSVNYSFPINKLFGN